MKQQINQFISNIKTGELVEFKNMAVMPLFNSMPYEIFYITLKEAMEKEILIVGETSSSGSVAELLVENKGPQKVLILDGEELMGAKQNRIVNATILIDAMSKIIIPVSCTEAGRWSYSTKDFKDSQTMMNYELRQAKTISVSRSLKAHRQYASDQGEVWDKINKMVVESNVKAPTGAMKDVFEEKESMISKYAQAFSVEKDQKGIMVFIDGKIAGFDILSLASAYEIIHPRLIKSYAMDAARRIERESKKAQKDQAEVFFEEIKSFSHNTFKSKGLGDDFRFEDEGSAGASLVYEGEIVHMSFLKAVKEEYQGRMSGYYSRMRNRYNY